MSPGRRDVRCIVCPSRTFLTGPLCFRARSEAISFSASRHTGFRKLGSLERGARTSIPHAVADCLDGDVSRAELLRLKVLAERCGTLGRRDSRDADWLRAAIIHTWATARMAAAEDRVGGSTVESVEAMMSNFVQASMVQHRAAPDTMAAERLVGTCAGRPRVAPHA